MLPLISLADNNSESFCLVTLALISLMGNKFWGKMIIKMTIIMKKNQDEDNFILTELFQLFIQKRTVIINFLQKDLSML